MTDVPADWQTWHHTEYGTDTATEPHPHDDWNNWKGTSTSPAVAFHAGFGAGMWRSEQAYTREASLRVRKIGQTRPIFWWLYWAEADPAYRDDPERAFVRGFVAGWRTDQVALALQTRKDAV